MLMHTGRLHKLLAACFLLSFCLIACAEKAHHATGWRKAVFYPENLDIVVLWSTQISPREPMDYKPLEDGGAGVDASNVYVGGRSKTLFRIDRSNGKILKSRKMGQEIFSRPVVGESAVYFGDAAGYLHALDKYSLSDIWVHNAKSEILATPVVVGEKLYYIAENETLTALELGTGKFIWEHKEEYHGSLSIRRRGEPLVVGDRLYQGFSNGLICAFDRHTGKLLWRRNLGKGSRFDDVNAAPILQDGMLYVASFDNGLFCLDADTGNEIWNQPIKSASSPMAIDGKLYLTSSESGFYCLNQLTGKIEWFIELTALFMKHEEGALSRPLKYGADHLIFSASGTGMYFVDYRNKRLTARFTPGNGISSLPTPSGNLIFTLSNGGYLYAVALGEKGSRYGRQ